MAPPERGSPRSAGTNPGRTGNVAESGLLKTQGLAYDRDLFIHTLVLPDGHTGVQKVGQGLSLC